LGLKGLHWSSQKDPQVLHLPELHFLKSYLESLGADIPPLQEKPKPKEEPKTKEIPKTKEVPKPKEEPMEEEPTDDEPDPDIVPADNDPPLPIGDTSKEVTDEMFEEATGLKIQAMDCQREGKFEESLNLFTKAIQINPLAGILYASRAQVLLDMKKPNAAIKDCETAIRIAPDSAKGYKIRGRAHRMLGLYELALRDYQLGQKLDFDETTKKLEMEIKPRADKVLEKKARSERLQREKEAREKEEERQRRKKAQQEAKQQSAQSEPFGGMGGMPDFGGMGGMGGMGEGMGGGMGGMPFGMDPQMLNAVMNDPDVKQAMQDPTFLSKLADIQQNPQNISKYANDPVIAKLLGKFGNQFSGTKGAADEDFPTADDVD